MKPQHHLDHSTILAYAAGTLDEAFMVVAASHLALCPTCRKAVHEAETLGGELLGQMTGNDVSDDCRQKTLAALDRASIHRLPIAAPKSELPVALSRLLNVSSFDQLQWKKKAPGVAMCSVKLPEHAKGKLMLMRIGAGYAMPGHGHGGEEITLVLKGAYRDHLGHFARGDVADLDEEIEHQPVVDKEQDCICLVATERPTRFKSVFARLMQPFVGI
jgi:putative transcriptional regulator